jgi:hypothetical protein
VLVLEVALHREGGPKMPVLSPKELWVDALQVGQIGDVPPPCFPQDRHPLWGVKPSQQFSVAPVHDDLLGSEKSAEAECLFLVVSVMGARVCIFLVEAAGLAGSQVLTRCSRPDEVATESGQEYLGVH